MKKNILTFVFFMFFGILGYTQETRDRIGQPPPPPEPPPIQQQIDRSAKQAEEQRKANEKKREEEKKQLEQNKAIEKQRLSRTSDTLRTRQPVTNPTNPRKQ